MLENMGAPRHVSPLELGFLYIVKHTILKQFHTLYGTICSKCPDPASPYQGLLPNLITTANKVHSPASQIIQLNDQTVVKYLAANVHSTVNKNTRGNIDIVQGRHSGRCLWMEGFISIRRSKSLCI